MSQAKLKSLISSIADLVERYLLDQIREARKNGIEQRAGILSFREIWKLIEEGGGKRNVFFLRTVKRELQSRGWKIRKEGNWYIFIPERG